MAEVITVENADGSVTTTVIEAGRTYRETVTPQEAARLALALYGPAGALAPGVGFKLPKSIAATIAAKRTTLPRVADYESAAQMAWDQQPELRSRGTLEQWWKSIGKDNRISTRASFAALKAERPNDSPAQAKAWWGSLSKNRRQKLRAKYSPGYGDDIFDDMQKVIAPVAKVVEGLAPIANAIPGYGPVIAAGIRNGARAAASINDPKKALAYMTGGEGGLKALALVRGASVSKTLGAAAKDLADVAPGMAGKLGATSQLNLSTIASGIGAPESATKLVAAAKKTAAAAMAKEGNRSPQALAAMLKQANNGRKALISANAEPARAAEILERVRAGRVRSSRGGTVTPDELAAAAAAGRVFFVS